MSTSLRSVEYKHVEVTLEDHILTLCLNSPDTLNALSLEMMDEIVGVLDTAHHDPEVRVLIITGAGRAFCAGGNVKAMGEISDDNARAHPLERPLWNVPSMSVADRLKLRRQTGREVMVSISKLDKPTIAAVNGLAAGAGCDLSLVCDVRFIAESARFSEIYVRRGLVPADGGMYWMPKIVGLGRALEILYSGDWVDSKEAYRIGLANRVLPDAELMDATRQFALRLADGPPLALHAIKSGVRQLNVPDFEESLGLSYEMCEYLLQTEDHKESVAAFTEKRPPVFSGR